MELVGRVLEKHQGAVPSQGSSKAKKTCPPGISLRPGITDNLPPTFTSLRFSAMLQQSCAVHVITDVQMGHRPHQCAGGSRELCMERDY